MEANKTQVTEFILTRLTDRPGLKVPLFLVFLVIYLITLVGNLGLILLIWWDPTFISPFFIQAFTFMTIMVSYIRVLFAILKKKSEKVRSKAFSTCSAHLLSVSLFYGTLFFMYVRPGPGPAENYDKMYSLFYTIVIPLLNPFIYGLRNKEVIGALRRVVSK